MDKSAFYNSLRPHINLTTQNVMGFDKVLDYGAARGTLLGAMAYILATAFWETGQTMQPVVEAHWVKNAEAWRKRNLRYYPWHGRGLIQTTWEANYRKMGPLISAEVGHLVDFTKNPDLLLEWEYSLPAMFIGMEGGHYTGKDLDDYIDNIDEDDAEDLREFTNARRIVNGTDKQVTIGKLALRFERALKAARWGAVTPVLDVPLPPKKPEPGEQTKSRTWAAIVDFFIRIFRIGQ